MEYTDGTCKFKVIRMGTVSDEINTIISNKQDKLTFDSTPTTGSANPVTSDGIKSALDSVTESLKVTTIPITINEELVRYAKAYRYGNIVSGVCAIKKVSGLSGDQLLISGLPVPITDVIKGFMTPWQKYYRYYIGFDGKIYEHYISTFEISDGNAVEFPFIYICA